MTTSITIKQYNQNPRTVIISSDISPWALAWLRPLATGYPFAANNTMLMFLFLSAHT